MMRGYDDMFDDDPPEDDGGIEVDWEKLASLSHLLGGVSKGPEGAITPKGRYGAHWGAAYDLYDDWRETLIALLASGQDFKAHWGAKKEIQWVTLQRSGKKVTITAEVQIDNPLGDSTVTEENPFHDAVWRAFGKMMPEEVQAEIAEAMEVGGWSEGMDDGFSTIYRKTRTYKVSDLDTLLGHAQELINTADDVASTSYAKAADKVERMVLSFVKADPSAWGFKSKADVDKAVRAWKKKWAGL